MARDLRVQLVLDTINKASAPLKAIGRDSDAAAAAIKASQQQLKALKQQQQDISSFRKLEGAVAESAVAMGEQQDRAEALARQLRATANPTKKLQREFAQAREEARKLKDAHQGNQHKLQQLGQQLRQSGIHTDRLDRHQASLQRQMRQANESIDAQKKKLGSLADEHKRLEQIKARADKIRGTGTTIATHGAGLALAGQAALRGLGGMVAPVAEAQAGGSLIAARQGQDSTQAAGYTKIINAIKASGSLAEINEVANALDGAAAAFGNLGETGADELQRITRHALNLSSAFGTDTAQSIQMAQIMVKNGLAGSADEAFDLITKGMQNVTAEMRGELPEILHEYSTHFRGMGFTGEQSMNLLVKMAEQGKFALDKTGDAIKEFSIRGSDMSKASVEAYELIGLNATAMSNAIATGGTDAQKALQATAKGLLSITDPAERANAAVALFGTPVEDLAIDQIPQFLEALGGAQNLLGDTAGAADALGKTLRNDLQGDLGKLSGSWTELKTALFETETGALRGFTQSLTDTVRLVTAWAQENPELAAWLVRITAIVAGVITAVGALGLSVSVFMYAFAGLMKLAPVLSLLKAFGPVLLTLGKVALPVVIGAVKALGTALVANPIGIAVAAIAGAAYLIYRNWEPIKAFFAGLWDKVKSVFDVSLGSILATLVNWSPWGIFYSAIQQGLGMLGIELPATFSEFGGNMIQGLIDGITGMFPNLSQKVSDLASSVGNWFKEKLGINSPSRVFEGFGGDLISGLLNGLTAGITRVHDTITTMAGSVSGWFKDKLGINSPSRVFSEHGGDVLAGLQQGLENHDTVLKPVDTLSKRLKQAGAGLTLGAVTVTAAAENMTGATLPDQVGLARYQVERPVTELPDVMARAHYQAELPTAQLPDLTANARYRTELPLQPLPNLDALAQYHTQLETLELPNLSASAQYRAELVQASLPPLQAVARYRAEVEPARLPNMQRTEQLQPLIDKRPPLQARPASAQQQAPAPITVEAIHVHAAPGMDEQAVARLVAQEIQKLHLQQTAATRSQLRDED